MERRRPMVDDIRDAGGHGLLGFDGELHSARGCPPPTDADTPGALAVAYSLAGDKDRAFENLQNAYDTRSDELPFVIRYPAFDAIHSDPRYADFMRRLDLPE